jgi:gamma-glutamyltranspeptidase/glutathione hydrolase
MIARGHSDPTVSPEDRSVGIITQTSGLSIIQVVESDHGGPGKGHSKGRYHKDTFLVGGADKRRDGTVGGR